jgi:hypothetical protein
VINQKHHRVIGLDGRLPSGKIGEIGWWKYLRAPEL